MQVFYDGVHTGITPPKKRTSCQNCFMNEQLDILHEWSIWRQNLAVKFFSMVLYAAIIIFNHVENIK